MEMPLPTRSEILTREVSKVMTECWILRLVVNPPLSLPLSLPLNLPVVLAGATLALIRSFPTFVPWHLMVGR